MKRLQLRQIIREEIRNLYLAEAVSEKDALKLSKMVEKAYGNRKFYKTKTSKNKDNVTVDILLHIHKPPYIGKKIKVKFVFYPAENDGNGEVRFNDPIGTDITDYLNTSYSQQVTFDVFKKKAPAILKYWNKQAMKDGVVEPF